ncbi:MAG: ATP synthase F1 subunit delta [Acidobacteriaceae bacterium]|nr:ATP synthase F1 subunit delta [Acidobacteriaceae bacterium]MBV9500050.1 ATP synthase F1 subunit delta [Acidobacteriaceae bacterium]
MTDALTRHYATALADAVFAPNSGLSPADALGQLKEVASVVTASKDLERAMLSPAVTKSRKQAVIARITDDIGVHRLIRNFLLVVIAHRRIKDLSDIVKDFELIVDERTGWMPAEIASARELKPEQRKEIERALGTKLGKYIRAHYQVDPALIGGVRARIASKEYDATVRGKLESMRQRLAANA